MRKLYLLRHAQADGGYDAPDKERLLTDHGIKQAVSIAAHLNNIQKTICSNAVRTKMTFEAIEKTKPDATQDIQYLETLYNAPAGDLLNALHDQDSISGDVLLIAHNPGIHQLANILALDEGSENNNRLMFDYAPASLSIFECPIEKWNALKPAENKLIDLIIPN